MAACANGHLNIVQLLHKSGAKLAARTASGNSGLHHAAENGHEAVVAWWLDQVAEVNLRGGGYELTPLMIACQKGHLNLAQLLHRRGANLEEKDNLGFGCLAHAAKNGHEAIVAWLLDLGLDVNESSDGVTPIMCACGKGQFEMAKLLKARGANLTAKSLVGENCVHEAAGSGNAALVGWLLDEGVSGDESNSGGTTPLLWACHEGHLDVARLLHSRGAKLNVKDEHGEGCLHTAVENGHEAVVAWLLDHGGNVNEPTDGGSTPLMSACEQGNLNIAKLLIDRGAHLHVIDTWTGKRTGDAIFRKAYDRDRYDVLLSLIDQNWPLPENWDQLPTEDASEDSSDEDHGRVMITRSAAVHDLHRVFREMALQANPAPAEQLDQALDPVWLSLAVSSTKCNTV